jgi:3-hydroxyisobutyrate dehydrogenase-like beta-hydroxyacid dehydrogenase
MGTIAILGTGLIGAAMAERLLDRGESVRVWNRTVEKTAKLAARGATVARDPASAVASASRIHIVVSDDAAVDAVLDALPPLDRHAVVIDHSTTSPAGTAARARRCDERAIAFLHAPIFMGPRAARDGTGLILCAGPRDRFEAVEPALAAMTGEVWWLGARADLAAAYKLFGNALLLTIAAGLSDVYRLARALEVSPTEAHALFDRFAVGATIGQRGAKMARGDYAPSFETIMARKDLRLMLESAGDLQVLPAVATLLDRAIAAGHAHDDVGSIGADVVPSAKTTA